jgi:hypothetical protein
MSDSRKGDEPLFTARPPDDRLNDRRLLRRSLRRDSLNLSTS